MGAFAGVLCRCVRNRDKVLHGRLETYKDLIGALQVIP
jgi:hypothetical protein